MHYVLGNLELRKKHRDPALLEFIIQGEREIIYK